MKEELKWFDLQFFAEEGGETDGGGEQNEGGDKNEGGEDKNTENKQNTDKREPEFDSEKLEKIIQSRVDKQLAKVGKEKAELMKELEKIKKEKMTDEELKQFELTEKEKEIAEREKTIKDKENRLSAIKALKDVGLDDIGSELALEVAELVTGDDEEKTVARVKVLSEVVKKIVAGEVDKTFKKNGRNINNGNQQGEKKDEAEELAKLLGKNSSSTSEQSKKIIENYI